MKMATRATTLSAALGSVFLAIVAGGPGLVPLLDRPVDSGAPIQFGPGLRNPKRTASAGQAVRVKSSQGNMPARSSGTRRPMFPNTLPGTKPLTINQPLDEIMVSGINRFAERELKKSVRRRGNYWKRNYRSHRAYTKSATKNRKRLQSYLGVVDPRVKDPRFEVLRTLHDDGIAGETNAVQAYFVRWRVLRGVTAEGILLQPKGRVVARVIALPDADWTPEQFCGLSAKRNVPRHLARLLARQGCQVVIPTLISRDDTHSGHPDVRYTNQPHRAFIYRMAFEMGRHIIGYEVQKVRAAVDAFERLNHMQKRDRPVGVVGVGEGGLLAFHSAAIDPRIDTAMICGYFQKRENLWQEPIYRNVWALLTEFGDADVATLIAPRHLVIEACAVPTVDGPPKVKPGRRGGAAPGRIAIAPLDSVRSEFQRAAVHYERLNASDCLTLAVSKQGRGPAGSKAALQAFGTGLGIKVPDKIPVEKLPAWKKMPRNTRDTKLFDPAARQKRQFDELVRHVQNLLENSARVRDRFWSKADRSSVKAWRQSARFYRKHVWEEMIGRLPAPDMPLNPRTRKVINEPTHQGYEVVLDVYPVEGRRLKVEGDDNNPQPSTLNPPPSVIAAGILLLPTDLKAGETRPVVVCQHGLEGTPMHTITTDKTTRAYRAYQGFSTQLVQRGFIVYAPQNPYRGGDDFRVIQRKSNPLKRSLFSYIIAQHQRTLNWLATLPFVDADRIGFYGLSYGGKTAVRVPPILVPNTNGPRDDAPQSPGYCLSICSADFNEWVRKNASNKARYSYVFYGEYEIFEWNMGHVANYAELASLMTPRPFMVERGHDDGVAPDEWVAWEYAKVRRHYDKLGLGNRTQIEFFNGPHTINGKGTFDFLHQHLHWPNPQ